MTNGIVSLRRPSPPARAKVTSPTAPMPRFRRAATKPIRNDRYDVGVAVAVVAHVLGSRTAATTWRIAETTTSGSVWWT